MKVLKYSLFFTTVASTSKLHEPLITSGCGIGAKARSGFPDASAVDVDSKTSTTGSNSSSFFIGSPLPGPVPTSLNRLAAASRMRPLHRTVKRRAGLGNVYPDDVVIK